MFESLNKKSTIMNGVNTEGMEFRKLKEFPNTVIPVKGFFFCKGARGGEQVVVISDKYMLNMPNRAVEQFKEIKENDEMLEAVLQGKLSIAVHEERVARNGNTTIYYDLVG